MNYLRTLSWLRPRAAHATLAQALQPSRSLSCTSSTWSLVPEMESVHTTERLAKLRALMKKHEVDIYSTLYVPRYMGIV